MLVVIAVRLILSAMATAWMGKTGRLCWWALFGIITQYISLLSCIFFLGDPGFVQGKAREILARALSNALQLPELKMSSPRSQEMMLVFQEWSATVKDNSGFADRLVSLVVKHAFTPSMLKAKSVTTKYEKMWTGYHQLIISDELSSLWHGTVTHVEKCQHFQHFMQLVTRRVMDEAVKTAFVCEAEESAFAQVQPLKAEEEQGLRYAAGYIPMKLKKKYEKCPSSARALKYMECLKMMNEEKGDDVEFLQYTTLWIEQVNRGGLFFVSNDTYLIFRAMELAARHVLSVARVTSHPTLKIRQEMEESIMNDPSVAAHWNYLMTKVDLDTDESDELLGEIVEKWVKIHRHSFANGWVEQYQIATKQSTKKKGLRKSLQDTCSDPDVQS